jgi:hypothetical protein
MNRQEAEEYLGVAKPAKIGKRTPTWDFNQAPSHWRKTLKLWAAVMLSFICGWIVIGMVAGIIERVWP